MLPYIKAVASVPLSSLSYIASSRIPAHPTMSLWRRKKKEYAGTRRSNRETGKRERRSDEIRSVVRTWGGTLKGLLITLE